MPVPSTSAVSAPVVTREQGVTVIAPGPEYEHLPDLHIDELKALFLEIGTQAEPPLVVLDLSQLRFFGSAFIEVMFRVWHQVNGRGGKFALAGLTAYCREVVEITHLDRLWGVF